MRVRRIIAAAAAAALTGGLLTAAASAPAATAPAVKVNGWTVGTVAQIEPDGTPLTFVFTVTNTGTKMISEALDGGDGAATLKNVTVTGVECIAEGHSGGGDGHTCEPDLVPGETLTLVETADLTTNVAGAVASIRACAYPTDGPGGTVCKTVGAKVG